MRKTGVEIVYAAIAPEAKENFSPYSTDSEFNTLNQLKEYNLSFKNLANPCELYQTILDGTTVSLPTLPQNENIGLWSKNISGDNGDFSEPIELILTSESNYSSSGFTFTFDKYNKIYPTKIKIRWYKVEGQTETDLGDEDFSPDDAVYFCEHKVDYYNKVVITFYSLNMPKNRLKLSIIDYGHGTSFVGNEIRNVRVIQEIDPISTQISINTADFIIDSKGDTEYYFKQKQPISIYFNGELKSTTFIKSAKRNTKFLWQIQSEDYIGLLDGINFHGGIYEQEIAVNILNAISEISKVPFIIDDIFNDVKVSGYIPYTTCRNALMHIAFAIQAVVDTSNSDGVKIFKLDENVKQTIPLKRIMQGQNFVDEEITTSVELSAHSYTMTDDTIVAYDASKSGTGKNIFVKFNEPLHDIACSGNGSIETSHTNYAIITASSNDFVLTGKKYNHTTQIKIKSNPNISSNTIQKAISIEKATLISNENVDAVLDKCYNWFIKNNYTNLKIVEGKHIQDSILYYGKAKYGQSKYGKNDGNIVTYDQKVNVGDMIKSETEYYGIICGIITKQSFNLNGGIIIKESILR